jgi:hypothetical protein
VGDAPGLDFAAKVGVSEHYEKILEPIKSGIFYAATHGYDSSPAKAQSRLQPR